MKIRSSLVLLVIVLGVIVSYVTIFEEDVHANWLKPCVGNDECGKIVGWIIDEDTNEIVEEEFAVSIIPYVESKKTQPVDYYALKINSGTFSISVKPGRYIIVFTPYAKGTKYCGYYNPHFPPKEDQIIIAEKGKITEIRKKVAEGGYIRVIIVNPNGEQLNFRDFFKDGNVRIYLSNKNIGYVDFITMDEQQMIKGEMLITNVIPGVYRIGAIFEDAGYGSSKMSSIEIERKKTTEYKLSIDPFNKTGIHGYLKDSNGSIINYSNMIVYNIINDEENFYATYCTGETGYYKITGIDEGIYSIRIETDEKVINIHNINIIKNILLDKDIVIN